MEQIFLSKCGMKKYGEQILLDENLRSKMGQNGEQVLLESNFLGRKFWGASFEGADSFGEDQRVKIFGRNLCE